MRNVRTHSQPHFTAGVVSGQSERKRRGQTDPIATRFESAPAIEHLSRSSAKPSVVHLEVESTNEMPDGPAVRPRWSGVCSTSAAQSTSHRRPLGPKAPHRSHPKDNEQRKDDKVCHHKCWSLLGGSPGDQGRDLLKELRD